MDVMGVFMDCTVMARKIQVEVTEIIPFINREPSGNSDKQMAKGFNFIYHYYFFDIIIFIILIVIIIVIFTVIISIIVIVYLYIVHICSCLFMLSIQGMYHIYSERPQCCESVSFSRNRLF